MHCIPLVLASDGEGLETLLTVFLFLEKLWTCDKDWQGEPETYHLSSTGHEMTSTILPV